MTFRERRVLWSMDLIMWVLTTLCPRPERYDIADWAIEYARSVASWRKLNSKV